jgi:type I restriction enzyme S subunit
MSNQIFDLLTADVPRGWRQVSIGDVLREVSEPIEMRDAQLYKLVSIRRRNGGMFLRDQLYGRQILTKDLQRVIPESFVIARRQIIHGASALAADEFSDAAVSSSYSLFLGREDCDIRFFAWLACHPSMYTYFLNASHGIVIEKMNFDKDRWLSYPINLPPLHEQRRISEILDTIDEAIRSTERFAAKLEQIKQGLLHDLLTRGIDESGHPRENRKQFKRSRIGLIPRTWDLATLDEISHGRGRYGSQAAAIPFDPDLPRYVRITDITSDGSLRRDSRAGITESDAQPHMLEEGDLCFARTGATVGKTYLYSGQDGPCAFAGYVIRFAIDSSRANPAFVSLWTQGRFYAQWVAGILQQGAQPNINARSYGKHELPIPPRAEQDAIVHRANTFLNAAAAEKRKIVKLRHLKRGLMDDLLIGRVRVGVAE